MMGMRFCAHTQVDMAIVMIDMKLLDTHIYLETVFLADVGDVCRRLEARTACVRSCYGMDPLWRF